MEKSNDWGDPRLEEAVGRKKKMGKKPENYRGDETLDQQFPLFFVPETEYRDMIRTIINAPEVNLFCRTNAFPMYLRMQTRQIDTVALAADVFREMKLEIGNLQKIFSEGEVLESGDQYHKLGAHYYAEPTGWSKLALLLGKKLNVYHRNMHETCKDYRLVYEVEPSGEVIRRN